MSSNRDKYTQQQLDSYTQEQLDLIDNAWTAQQCKDQQMEIGITVSWWGYTIKLNKAAVQKLDLCLDYLEEELGNCNFKGEIRTLISFCIQFKQFRLNHAVDKDEIEHCARLISPWVMPFALVVVRGSSGNDPNLWSTVWDPDKREWGEAAEFNECETKGAPALAQHGDLLYCVFRGNGLDEQLKWTVYSTNDGWSDAQDFPSHSTTTNPSLAEFHNTLYCFHRGASDDFLYYCTFDDTRKTWNPDIMIKVGNQAHSSRTGCAVAVFNEELHMVYQSGDSRAIYHITFDGNTWRTSNNPTAWTSDTPALVAYRTSLLMVHRGKSDEGMYYCTYNGNSWSTDTRIPNMTSSMGPGLAVFGDEVFMVHRSGLNNGELYYSIYNGSGWRGKEPGQIDTVVSGQSTGAPPAIACYTDPQCNSDNYTDPKTVEPRLICVHRGWGN